MGGDGEREIKYIVKGFDPRKKIGVGLFVSHLPETGGHSPSREDSARNCQTKSPLKLICKIMTSKLHGESIQIHSVLGI